MALAGTLTDSFPGTAVDTSKWNQNNSAGNTVSGNVVTIAGAATANVYGNGSLYSHVTYDGRGTAISVKVNRVATGLAAGETNHPVTSLGYSSATGGTGIDIDFEDSTGNIRFRSTVDYDDAFQVSIPYNSSVHVYWRIRSDTTNTFYETSVDGYNWTLQRTIAYPPWLNIVNPYIGVDNKPAISAQFSSFNVLPSPPSGAKIITLTDDFLASTLDAKWDSNGTTAIVNGTVEVGAGDIHSHDQYDMTGSSVGVQVKRVAAGGSAITYLNVAELDGSTGTSLRITRDVSNSNLSFQVFLGFGDDGTSAAFDVTYDPASMQYWQIWNNSGITKFQTSPDGTNWTDRRVLTGSTTPPSPTWLSAVSLYLSVDGSPTTTAVFDNVNIFSAPPGTVLPKANTFTDDFSTTFDTTKWDSYGTVVTSSGVLDISTNGAALSSSRLDATASSASVHVVRVAEGGTPSAITNFTLNSITGGTNLRFSHDSSSGLLSLESQVDYNDATPEVLTYDSGSMPYWRFREFNSALYFEISSDAINWGHIRVIPSPSWLNSVQISLSVDASGTVPTTSAQFDDVNIIPAIVQPDVLPLAETLQDSFLGGTIDTSKWSVTGTIMQSGDMNAIATYSGSYITSNNLYDLRESNYIGYVTPDISSTSETFFQVSSSTPGTMIQFLISDGILYAKNLIQNIDPDVQNVPMPSTSVWLRISCVDATIYMDYSLTGQPNSWITLNSFSAPTWVSSTRFRWGDDIIGGIISPPEPPLPPVVGPSHNTGLAPPTGTDITVDFRSSALIPVAVLDKWSIGNHFAGLSSPDAIKGSAADVATWKATLKALGPMVWRCPIRWNNGSPGSAAGGAQTSAPDGLNYIKAMFEINGFPYLSIGGNTADNNMSNSDCSNLIHYFNDSAIAGGKLERICMGNEATNGGSAGIAAYISALPGWCNAVKIADSSVLISAPADGNGDPSGSLMTGALSSGADFDILSLHAYDLDKGPTAPVTYGSKTTTMRSMFASAFPAKAVIVGFEEFNQHADYTGSAHHTTGDDWWNDYHNTVAFAETIGRILQAGGHAYSYCDSGDAMGLLANGNGNQGTGTKFTRSPSYWGIGMWTGMDGMFKRANPPNGGTQMVNCTSNTSDLRVFAVNNGKVIVVNYSTTDHNNVVVGIGNRTAGSYHAWQTTRLLPNNPPVHLVNGATYTNAKITLSFPQGTVTSLDLD